MSTPTEAKTVATFTATVTGDEPAVAVADLVAASLADSEIDCGGVAAIGSGARLETRVGKRAVPVFFGPVSRESSVDDRWFLTMGESRMPLAKLLGLRGADARGVVAEALMAVLERTPGIADVEWHDEETWFGA